MTWRTFSFRIAVIACGYFLVFVYYHADGRFDAAARAIDAFVMTAAVAAAAFPWRWEWEGFPP